MTLWLAGTLGPDEHILADANGFTGPGRLWDHTLGLIALAGMVLGWQDFFSAHVRFGRAANLAEAGLYLAGAAGGLLLLATRAHVYVAITERQLICVRVRGRFSPAGIMCTAPIGSLSLMTKRRPGLNMISVPAPDSKRGETRLRLRAGRARREELLAAIQAGGGTVDLPPVSGSPRVDLYLAP